MTDSFKRVLWVVVAALVLGLRAGTAQAHDLTAIDGNSSITIDSHSQSGLDTWSVDGTDHMFQQWFWGRAIDDTFDGDPCEVEECSLESIFDLDLLHHELHVPNIAHIRFATVIDEGVNSVDLLYTLTGGAAGSGASSLDEVITIFNADIDPLDVVAFAYADFDLAGSIGGDTASFDGTDTFTQSDGGTIATFTSVDPLPDHWEIAFWSSTRTKLNDADIDVLTDLTSPLGPGDTTTTFEYDLTIPAGGSTAIHLSKSFQGERVQPVIPEPGTMLLFGLGGLGAGFVRRRRAKLEKA